MGLRDALGFGPKKEAASNGSELALKRAFDSLLVTSRRNVDVSEIPGDSNEEAVSNTRWFLIGENANYELNDELATDDSGGLANFVDPSNPPTPGANFV